MVQILQLTNLKCIFSTIAVGIGSSMETTRKGYKFREDKDAMQIY